MSQIVFEIVEYRFKSDVDHAKAFASFNAAIGEFCQGRPGFISRDVVRKDDVLMDIVQWQSLADAEALAKDWEGSRACAVAKEMIDMDSVKMSHMTKIA